MADGRKLLEIERLRAGYGNFNILCDVSLYVAEREFVALIGPNGAGKTTVLRAIAGLISPVSGAIRFLDCTLGGLRPNEISRRGIFFISEDSSLFLGMSVEENLLLGAYAATDRKQVSDRKEHALDLFPILGERRKQLAGTLSGGERKMLGLARGFMSNPRLLLVDEPSLGLAPKIVATVIDALERFQRQGIAILMVEQNVLTTLRVTERAYVLEQGRVVLEGASSELLGNPQIQESYLGVM